MADSKPHGFTLPSARHVADLTVFFDKATLNKDGSITLILKLPSEMGPNILDLRTNDGMALNARVWETRMPDGMEQLAAAVGMTLGRV